MNSTSNHPEKLNDIMCRYFFKVRANLADIVCDNYYHVIEHLNCWFAAHPYEDYAPVNVVTSIIKHQFDYCRAIAWSLRDFDTELPNLAMKKGFYDLYYPDQERTISYRVKGETYVLPEDYKRKFYEDKKRFGFKNCSHSSPLAIIVGLTKSGLIAKISAYDSAGELVYEHNDSTYTNFEKAYFTYKPVYQYICIMPESTELKTDEFLHVTNILCKDTTSSPRDTKIVTTLPENCYLFYDYDPEDYENTNKRLCGVHWSHLVGFGKMYELQRQAKRLEIIL